MSAPLYCYADMGRAGLGNMLLVWARAEAFRHRHGARMLAPRWTQPKIGPLLRGEKDLRYYVGLFDNPGYVSGLSKALARWRCAAVDEENAPDLSSPPGSVRVDRPTLIRFHGLRDWFARLFDLRDMLDARLHEILAAKWKERLAAFPHEPYIGVHFRRGDKITLKDGEPYPAGKTNYALPTSWFVNSVRNLRRLMGGDYPVRVFSDDNKGDLQALLDLPNTTLISGNPAILDILLLARSRVVVTTAHSSFSAWAVYLGRQPSVWYPTLGMDLVPGKPQYACETSLDGDVPDSFGASLREVA